MIRLTCIARHRFLSSHNIMGNFVTSLRQYFEDWFISSWRHNTVPLLTDSKHTRKPKKEESCKSPPNRPNYFVCLKIDNSDILKALRSVQENILSNCPAIKPALTSIDCLHITLMVFNIDSKDRLDEAKKALDEVVSRVKSGDTSATGDAKMFSVHGLGNFRQQVLFAHIDNGREIVQDIGMHVKESYENRGIFSTDLKPLNLHATILKLSKSPKLRKKGIKKINTEWFANDKDTFFGFQQISDLLLCSMEKPKITSTKFYHVEHTVPLFNCK